jgi:hypothetical protein
VVLGALVRVVVGSVVVGGGVTVVGAAGIVPRDNLDGDEWKLNKPTSPATVESRTIGALFIGTCPFVARSFPPSLSRKRTFRGGFARAARRVDGRR